ncbi:MAG: replication factor C large subunit, partial [Thermoplasmatota archaeon]
MSPALAAAWTEKHRPHSLADLVGNGPAVADLSAWAQSWLSGPPPKERACVLAGPPGVGKTSAAHALAHDMGWNVVEMNASDTRNYDAIRRVATPGSLYASFSPTGAFDTKRLQLVILDEADNLFGTEDRGGMRAIVETVREARNPVLLIVNDLYAFQRKASGLTGIAHVIKFTRVHKRSIPNALRRIAQTEGIVASPEALNEIAERSGGDLRSALNDFEAVAAGRKVIELQDVEALGKRDEVGDVWALLGKVFYGTNADEARKATWDLDETPDSIALWIDENLPVIYKDPADLLAGYRALARADVFLGRVTRRQQFGLWSYASEMMTAGVAVAKYEKPQWNRFQFPSWLRKMSATRGTRDLRDGAAAKVGAVTHSSIRAARAEYIPVLRRLLEHDDALAVRVANELELTIEELAFILDDRPTSVRLKKLERAMEADGEPEDAPADEGGAALPKKRKGKPKAEGKAGATKGTLVRAHKTASDGVETTPVETSDTAKSESAPTATDPSTSEEADEEAKRR